MTELWDVLRRELVYLWYYFDLQLRQIFIYWVIGILIGSCISVFLKERIHGLFRAMSGSKFGILGLILASLLGIASPLCMYGTIPLAASVSKSGIVPPPQAYNGTPIVAAIKTPHASFPPKNRTITSCGT